MRGTFSPSVPLQMEVNSVEKLCKVLVAGAFRRCRILDEICRLSVSLKPAPPLVQISVSDTGVGSTLEEFQQLQYQNDPILDGKWDGVICIATTSTRDKEIHHIKFDLKEIVPCRRLVRLPSTRKNGAKFSGTEVSLALYEDVDGLVTMMSDFIQKMLILKMPKIAVDLSVVSGGLTSQPESIVLQTACTAPVSAKSIDCLKLGLEDYVSKHGNRLAEACHSCFSTGEKLKVGTGLACSRANQQSGKQVMEVVIIISETSMSNQSSCSRNYGTRTEVLYFRDFSPYSISQSSLDALTSFEWKTFGLILKSIGDQDGVTLLEWENLPPHAHIDIVLHRYHKQLAIPFCAQTDQIDRSLTRKALKIALTKLKNAGVLLSGRAVKICSYAPDLARTISALIMSSHDLEFQAECLSLLGLQSGRNETNVVEDCIEDKIISVVVGNDRDRWGHREAPLFEDNLEYGEGGVDFDHLDL